MDEQILALIWLNLLLTYLLNIPNPNYVNEHKIIPDKFEVV